MPARAAELCRRAIYPVDGSVVIPNDRAALAMPMDGARGPSPVVYLSSVCEKAFCDSRESIVRAIECAAAPYAIALVREADRSDAIHDGLTGLLTARAFRRQLHDEFSQHAEAPLSLWFVDTDNFKTVNDRFGHQTGDRVLQSMANVLRASIDPACDFAGRNGGDEFCALLRGVSKSSAIERAAAFCAAVRAFDFGLGERMTASVGVATHPYDASTSSALLEIADGAMYHSKRNGRDRVSFVAEAEAEPSRSSLRWRSIVEESCVRSRS
ncbi:MAG: GGDEF domain-containing protein [Candidatus Eremiobacteraeota bacterium]|nr:GGDEF domain-containing protein [Candidatus Eremiobacteraeota bacterium]